MSTPSPAPSAAHEPSGPPGAPAAPRPAPPGPARGSFAMAAVVTAFAVYLTHGLLVMDVREGGDGGPGPRFFPLLVLVLAWVVVAGLALDAVRERRRAHREVRAVGDGAVGDGDEPGTAPTDWRAVALVAATFAVFTAVLVPLGWLVAGTWLFWGTAQALGSRRRLFDAGVALAVASVVQLAFGAGLGLNLPAGLLGL